MERYLEYLQCLYWLFPIISSLLILIVGVEEILKMKNPTFEFNTMKILLIKMFLEITRFILLLMICGYLTMWIIHEFGLLEVDHYFFNGVPVFTLSLVFASWKTISRLLQSVNKFIEKFFTRKIKDK